MAICLHHSRARGTAKVVLLGIANHDGDGGAWPAVSTLAKYANVAERNVQKALRDLEALGEIRTDCRGGGTAKMRGGDRPNMYVILVRCPADCDRSTAHRLLSSHVVTNSSPHEVTESSPHEVTPASPEPSGEPSGESSSGMEWPTADAVGAQSGFSNWRAEDRALFIELVGSDRIESDPESATARIRFTEGRWDTAVMYDAIVKAQIKAKGEPIKWPGRYLAQINEHADLIGDGPGAWLARLGLYAA